MKHRAHRSSELQQPGRIAASHAVAVRIPPITGYQEMDGRHASPVVALDRAGMLAIHVAMVSLNVIDSALVFLLRVCRSELPPRREDEHPNALIPRNFRKWTLGV